MLMMGCRKSNIGFTCPDEGCDSLKTGGALCTQQRSTGVCYERRKKYIRRGMWRFKFLRKTVYSRTIWLRATKSGVCPHFQHKSSL